MVDQSQNNDHEETTRLKEGDQDAFNQIFNRYQTKLIVYTAAIVKSEAVAKDLVQETFIRLWVNRHDLDPERSEEHTSELQSRGHLVCRLLLEKKKKTLMYYCICCNTI